MTTNNLLEVIDQMIEAECGISSCSFEISHILRKIRKLIIADRERMVKALGVWEIVDERGNRLVHLDDAISIVTEGKEQGDRSDKQE